MRAREHEALRGGRVIETRARPARRLVTLEAVRELRPGMGRERRAPDVGRVAARAARIQRGECTRALVAVAALAVDLEVHAGQREAGTRVRLEAGHARERRRVVAARAVGGEAALVHIDVTAPAVVGRELRLVEAQVQVARAARHLRVPAEQPEARVRVVAELHVPPCWLPRVCRVARRAGDGCLEPAVRAARAGAYHLSLGDGRDAHQQREHHERRSAVSHRPPPWQSVHSTPSGRYRTSIAPPGRGSLRWQAPHATRACAPASGKRVRV